MIDTSRSSLTGHAFRWLSFTGGSPERYDRNITGARLYADQLDNDLRKLAGPLPCCLREKGADRRLLQDADMISQCQDVAGLIEMLEKELARF